MSLTIVSIEEGVANEDTLCDACKDFLLQYFNNFDDTRKRKYIPVAFNCRHRKVEKGEAFLRYTFVDEEGEFFEMNCGAKIDAIMFKDNLYPIQLLDAFKKYIG